MTDTLREEVIWGPKLFKGPGAKGLQVPGDIGELKGYMSGESLSGLLSPEKE